MTSVEGDKLATKATTDTDKAASVSATATEETLEQTTEQMQAEMNARMMSSQAHERPWNEGWVADAKIIEDDQSYWLLTMVDLMTLLLTLFVLLAAYAYHQKNTVTAEPASGQQTRQGSIQPETPKPGLSLPTAGNPNPSGQPHLIGTRSGPLIATAPQSSATSGGTKPAESSKVSPASSTKATDESTEQQNAERMFAGLGKDVDIKVIKGRINLRVRDNILFSTGEALLSSKGSQLIDRLAKRLNQGKYAISVEGHTDDLPIHTNRYPSNWELSAARAASVLRELIRHGVAPERLSAVGLADTRPIASNDTATGRAANRRVDLVLHLKGKG